MNPDEIKNAVISDTGIYVDEHGRLNMTIVLKADNQGWVYGSESNMGEFGEYLGKNILDLMDCFEVSEISELKGKPVRVSFRQNGKVSGVGHFIKRQWFSF